MNNYSALQKLLHRISLQPKFVRELSFDFEKQFFLKSAPTESSRHTFVTGLARSGTTILLRALHETSQYASLTYADMPFVLAPNLWSKLNRSGTDKQLAERAHGDGILVNTESPEAFEEVFWMTLDDADASNDFNKYIQLILRRYGKPRYLSKNNQNVKRLSTLIGLFPAADFLVPFRDPLQHAQSLFAQHTRFCEAQSTDEFVKDYMDWIGHSEFGLSYRPIVERALEYPDPSTFNHWLEQWVLLYTELMAEHRNSSGVLFVCYEKLCSDKTEWRKILHALDLEDQNNFDFRESRKPIDFAYDEELATEASRVYKELKSI